MKGTFLPEQRRSEKRPPTVMGTKRWHLILFVAIVLAVAAALHPTRYRSGWMFLRSGKIGEAIKRLSIVSQKDPHDYRAMRMLAQALEEEGRTGEAGELYERAVALKPSESGFQELVRFYTWTQQPQEARRAAWRWYEHRQRERRPFRDEVGRQLLEDLASAEMLSQDYPKAIEVLTTYQKAFPAEAASIEGDLIGLYEKSGDVEATASYLEGVLADDPDDTYALETFVEIAPLCRRSEVARGYLVRDLERRAGDEQAWNRLLDFEVRTGDLGAARRMYQKKIEAEPQDDRLRRGYVQWLIGTEQLEAAIAYLEGISGTAPDPSSRETLIQLYEWTGAKDKLLPIYRERFQRNPSDRKNAEVLVWALTDARHNEEAERVLQRLVGLFPRDREYARMLVDLYEARGDSSGAISALEKSARATDDPKLLKRLGEHYLWNARPNP